jgi:ABC-type transport system substrate-binding protein
MAGVTHAVQEEVNPQLKGRLLQCDRVEKWRSITVRIRRSAWQYVGVSALAVFAMFVSASAPAGAASVSLHPSLKASSTHSKAIPVRCKTRNKSTGTIKYSDWQFPDTLNPYQTNASVSWETISSMLDGLIQFNHSGKAYPVLLSQIPTIKNGGVLNGGKTVVAHLKQGIRWSDGAELTSADVKFGWELANNKASGPQCLGTCDIIKSIDTHGKYDLTFHLKSVYAPFINLAIAPPTFFPWPVQWKGAWAKGDVAAAVAKIWQDTTFNFENSTDFPTTGAYQVAQFNKDDRIVMHPMKYYGTMTCGAHVQTLIFAFYANKPSLIAAAASHQTDATTDYTLADVPELQKHTDAYSLHTDPGFLIEHLTFNIDKSYNGNANPLSEVKFRQALARARHEQEASGRRHRLDPADPNQAARSGLRRQGAPRSVGPDRQEVHLCYRLRPGAQGRQDADQSDVMRPRLFARLLHHGG